MASTTSETASRSRSARNEASSASTAGGARHLDRRSTSAISGSQSSCSGAISAMSRASDPASSRSVSAAASLADPRRSRPNGGYGEPSSCGSARHDEPPPVSARRDVGPRARAVSCRRRLRRRARRRLRVESGDQRGDLVAASDDRTSASRSMSTSACRRTQRAEQMGAAREARLPLTVNGSSACPARTSTDTWRTSRSPAMISPGCAFAISRAGKVGGVAHHDVRAALRMSHVADEHDTEVGADAQRERRLRRRSRARREASARRRVRRRWRAGDQGPAHRVGLGLGLQPAHVVGRRVESTISVTAARRSRRRRCRRRPTDRRCRRAG